MQNAIGRELYGRGYDFGSLSQNNTFRNNALIRAMRNGNGELMGIAQLFLWATAFGYLSMQTKLMLRGQTPRPADNVSTWTAAMAQGGGLGILGISSLGSTTGSEIPRRRRWLVRLHQMQHNWLIFWTDETGGMQKPLITSTLR